MPAGVCESVRRCDRGSTEGGRHVSRWHGPEPPALPQGAARGGQRDPCRAAAGAEPAGHEHRTRPAPAQVRRRAADPQRPRVRAHAVRGRAAPRGAARAAAHRQGDARRGGLRSGDERADFPADDERLRHSRRPRTAAGPDERAGARRTPAHRPPRPGRPLVGPHPARVRRPDRTARLRVPGRVAPAVARSYGVPGRPRPPASAPGRPDAGRPGRASTRCRGIRAGHPHTGRPGLRRARH